MSAFQSFLLAVVERLFMALMIIIIGISLYNTWRYFSI